MPVTVPTTCDTGELGVGEELAGGAGEVGLLDSGLLDGAEDGALAVDGPDAAEPAVTGAGAAESPPVELWGADRALGALAAGATG